MGIAARCWGFAAPGSGVACGDQARAGMSCGGAATAVGVAGGASTVGAASARGASPVSADMPMTRAHRATRIAYIARTGGQPSARREVRSLSWLVNGLAKEMVRGPGESVAPGSRPCRRHPGARRRR